MQTMSCGGTVAVLGSGAIGILTALAAKISGAGKQNFADSFEIPSLTAFDLLSPDKEDDRISTQTQIKLASPVDLIGKLSGDPQEWKKAKDSQKTVIKILSS